MFKLLTSYHGEQHIFGKVNRKIPFSCLLDHKVPKGSILGSLFFFLLCINDLPNASNFETTLFADDTNLHLSHLTKIFYNLLFNKNYQCH